MPPDDCRRLISESTTPFLGQIRRSFVSSADFTLHRMTVLRNSFKPYAYVTLSQAASGGTLVTVTFSAARSVRVFMALWFGFLVLWTLLALPAVVQQGGPGLIFPLAGMGMATFGFLLNPFGRLMGSHDAAFLLGFLQDELHLLQPPAWAMPIV